MRRLVLIGGIATLALAASAYAAFYSQATTPSNSFTANSSFCVNPSSSTVTAGLDTFYQEDKTPSGQATTSPVVVQPNTTKRRRSFFRFTLPTLPHNCFVTASTMTLTEALGATGHTIDVYATTSAVTETNSDPWANQPTFGGTAVGAASAATGSTVNWAVTSLVPSSYAAGATIGFAVVDHAEGTSSGLNSYNSREAASGRPSLSVTWG